MPPLVAGVRRALVDEDWELLLVDDGSTDATVDRILAECREDGRVRLVQLARNYGQSTAMQAGFDHAEGDVLVTMDGDLQNDPSDIPSLVEKLEDGYDIVVGYRLRRQDKFVTRKVPSWIANRIIARVTGVAIRDNGCSLKAYRRELFSRMRLYSDMHRFIPAMAVGTAGARVTEVPVKHHARAHGQSKYGISRVLKVLADLLTIKMVRSFRTRPLVLAGYSGATCLVFALAFVAAAVVAPAADGIVVLSGAALTWAVCGLFLVMLGLIGETVVRDQDLGSRLPSPLSREVF